MAVDGSEEFALIDVNVLASLLETFLVGFFLVTFFFFEDFWPPIFDDFLLSTNLCLLEEATCDLVLFMIKIT